MRTSRYVLGKYFDKSWLLVKAKAGSALASKCPLKNFLPLVGQIFNAIQAAKGAKAYEKAEDPIYALENNLPIDFQHYLEHHISQPIMRIFEPMMNNPKDLLSGATHAFLP